MKYHINDKNLTNKIFELILESVELFKINIYNIALLEDKETVEVYLVESRCSYTNEFKTESITIDLFHDFDEDEMDDSDFCLRTSFLKVLYLDDSIDSCITLLKDSLTDEN